ncbi:MAG: ABC transporter permease [Acidobacteriota bacterium]
MAFAALSLALTRRLAGAVATLLLLASLSFALLGLAPGDAFPNDDPRLTAADRARQREALGLDGSLPQRYAQYVSHAVKGDFGVSIQHARPVRGLVAERLLPSVFLGGSAVLIAFSLGLWFGTRAALRPHSVSRMIVDRLLPALDAMPAFWLGLMGLLVFANWLGWLPSGGLTDAMQPDTLLARLRHLLLPALTLGVPASAVVARHHAAALQRELTVPSARALRCLGVDERQVVRRALRRALHPSIVLLGLSLPALAGGTAIVEDVFAWPGLGQLQISALLGRDLPLAVGSLLVLATAVLLGGALSEMIALWVDPRWGREGIDA